MSYQSTPGSAGRITAISTTPILTTPAVSAAGGAEVILAEITGFDFTDQMTGESPKSLTYESSASAQGVLYPDPVRGGTGEWSVNINGNYDITAPYTGSRLANGMFIKFGLYLFKTTNYVGIDGLFGRVHNFRITSAVNAKLVTFTCSVEGFGVPPAFGVIVP